MNLSRQHMWWEIEANLSSETQQTWTQNGYSKHVTRNTCFVDHDHSDIDRLRFIKTLKLYDWRLRCEGSLHDCWIQRTQHLLHSTFNLLHEKHQEWCMRCESGRLVHSSEYTSGRSYLLEKQRISNSKLITKGWVNVIGKELLCKEHKFSEKFRNVDEVFAHSFTHLEAFSWNLAWT